MKSQVRRTAIRTWAGLLATWATVAAGPVWEKPSLFLGSLDGDGGLRQRFQLGVLSGSPEFSFPVFLEHGFRLEEPVTEYRIPQLETYVAPEGRDRIAWLEPGGIQHVFKLEEILESPPARQTVPWVAIRAGDGNYEFRSDDGWTYRYESGAIRSLAAPTGRVLEFETEGLRVSRIFQRAGEREITLLEAGENDIGLIGKLSIGPVNHRFDYSEDSEQLVRWQAPQMGRNSVSFSYSPAGLVETVTLPGDQKLRYTWGGPDGNWQKDSGLELPAIQGRAFLIADNDFKFQFGLNKAGINLLRTDALGIREGFSYNPRTQQLVRKNRDGGETTEFFGVRGPSQNRLESTRDARGRETVRLTYDDKGRVLTRTAPGQAEIRYEYDDLDRITRVFRLKGLQTAYEYKGDFEKPVKITNALGDTIEIAYQPDGQVKRYKNLDGAVYEYRYDALGQLVEERHPMGYTKTIERDDFGRLTRIKEIDGRETRYDYSAENRLTTVLKDGSTWHYEYDPDGQLSRLLRDGETWQKTEREKIAGTDETIVRETNSRGDETVYQLSQDGRITREVDALGQATTYKRDAVGHLKGWEDSRGVTVDLERDALGRIAGVDTGDDARLEMAYDLTGRIRSRNNGEQNIRFEYDKAGRLVRIDYGKGQVIEYAYDDCGRVLTATTGQGVKTTYTWDRLDRKTSERNDIPGAGYTLLEWTYTTSGRKASVAVSKGEVPGAASKTNAKPGDPVPAPRLLQKTSYSYDQLGRCTVISVNDTAKVWYDYDATTLRLARKRFFNSWVIAYEHFEHGYPKSIIASDHEGKVVTDCHYVWREDGKLDQRTLNGILHRYHYDALGRLSEVTKSTH